MDLKKIHHCTVVAACGSFTRAASALGVRQSVLSRHVAEVEAWLDTALLRRTGRGVVLTEAGAELVPRLRRIAADTNQALEVARTLKGAAAGTVRLGCLRSLGPHLLTPLLTLAAERLPDVRIHVVEGLADHLDELLVAGRLDIGLLYDDRQVPSPTDEVLFRPHHCLIGWPGDPVTAAPTVDFSVLAQVPLALPDVPNRLRVTVDRLCRENGIQARIGHLVDAVDSMKDFAAAGRGHTLLPFHFVRNDVAAGRIQASRIVNPEIVRPVVLGTSTTAPLTSAGIALAALIRGLVAEMVRNGPFMDARC
jgi:DNA-binding transcriptional LysR family regulator